MMRQLLARLGWAALTLLGTSVIVFLLVHLVPADPARAIAAT
jgi:ABC-type dipeptide/oligopeptide/nickel transport system permease component